MGVNIGALFGPLITGWAQQNWGFHLGFGLAAIGMATGVVHPGNLSSVVTVLSVVAAVGIFAVLLTSRQLNANERSRVVAFIPMFIGAAGFWALYQQQFTVITVYSEVRLDRQFGGWDMPIAWVNSMAPIFVILLVAVIGELLTSPVGLSLAGVLAQNYSADNEAPYFGVLGGAIVGVLMLLIAKPIHRAMKVVD